MQFAHAPQDRKLSTTWSPTSIPVTSAPTASTTPDPSWPKTLGNISSGRKPLRWMSVWHRPVATIRTRTSSARGASSSTSARAKSWPFFSTIATVVLMGGA